MQLVANARVVFETLTALKSTHSNKDVRASAEETISATLHEVQLLSQSPVSCIRS